MSCKCNNEGHAVAIEIGHIFGDLMKEGFDPSQAFILAQEFARNHRYDPDTMRWAQGGER